MIFTIEDGELKVLLINRVGEPFKGSWRLPGGFYLKERILIRRRKGLADKAGVDDVYVEQLYDDDLKRDPRGYVLSVAYFALVNKNKIK